MSIKHKMRFSLLDLKWLHILRQDELDTGDLSLVQSLKLKYPSWISKVKLYFHQSGYLVDSKIKTCRLWAVVLWAQSSSNRSDRRLLLQWLIVQFLFQNSIDPIELDLEAGNLFYYLLILPQISWCDERQHYLHWMASHKLLFWYLKLNIYWKVFIL